MFTHDPFQNYAGYSPYLGATPFGNPYATLQHPASLMNPLAGVAGYGGIHPHQLHALAAQAQLQQQFQNPLQQFQNPQQQFQGPQQQLQNPLIASLLQNPLLLASLQQPYIPNPYIPNPYLSAQLQSPLLTNPLLSQQGFGQQGFGQQGFGYGQQQGPFSPYAMQPQYGQQLQPQSWVGQSFGGINPLASRQPQGAGIPWGVS